MSADTVARDEVICALAEDGYTHAEIAEEFDLSPTRVTQILRQARVASEVSKQRHKLAERREEMLRLAEQGLTTSEIAKQLGISYRACWQALKKRGVKAVEGKRGHPLMYSEEETLRAIAEFLDTSGSSSARHYQEWSEERRAEGERVPTPTVAANRFGSWPRARELAQRYRKVKR